MIRYLAVVVFLVGLAPSSLVQATDLSSSLAFVYDDGFGNTLPYRLFLPPGYDTPGAEFPLVLFLHGAGEIGNDNLAQVGNTINGLVETTQSAEHASFVLAPQVQPGQGGWSRLYHPTALATAMDLTLQVIDQLEQTYAIDPTRRSVTGLSMGGFGTFDVIAKRPEMFAAAAPMSGGGDPDQAENLTKTPIWNYHGRRDPTVSVELSRNVIGAIERAGGDPIYIEDRGRHSGWDLLYNDPNNELYPWLIGGIAPPLATAIYNPNTGNLKIDASIAPGGEISAFTLISDVSFNLQPTVEVEGATVNTEDFIEHFSEGRTIRFNQNYSSSFGGLADLGTVMPLGLSSEEIHAQLGLHQYSSPATGTGNRTFRLIMEIPEPSPIVLVCIGMVAFVASRRERGALLGTLQSY